MNCSSVALLRMSKHCVSCSAVVSGCLLGLDNADGEIEVTNVFLHPARGAADFQPQQDDQPNEAALSGEYQAESLRLLKSANLDANIVGWFQSSTLSSFVTEATVEIQFDYQTQNNNSILIVVEDGKFNAYQLSEEYMQFLKTIKERKIQGPATLVTGGPVSFNSASQDVFVQVPMKVSLSILDEAYLFEHRTEIGTPTAHIDDQAPTIAQLAEVVEDLAIEKVRFEQFAKVSGQTRIRGEDDGKRMQSANDLILLTENAKRLINHLK